MYHKKRNHSLGVVTSFAELASKLTRQTWTPCSGFVCGSLTLLNDSTSADGAQEYAVIRAGRQIESLTCSWMSAEELQRALERLDTGKAGVDMGHVEINAHPVGSCAHCA
jgi:hypothetical protein